MLAPKIEYVPVGGLQLDPRNPRLGRHNVAHNLSQADVLKIMKDWNLEEIGVSFLESGFWPQEALLVIEERVANKDALLVVEGNRRLAALKKLWSADEPRWAEMVEAAGQPAMERLKEIPIIRMADRKSVLSYLGFRHVTGIAEWNPAEKAEFIAKLIEDENLTYEQVRKRIGSKTPTVRQNYISYRLLLQMEDSDESVAISKVEDRFSVLYLSLRTRGVQKYLQIDISAEPSAAKKPVPPEKLRQLANFALWLFGKDGQDPVVPESRDVDEFGRILESESAVAYLERTPRPNFEVASRMAGVAESEISEHVERAADELEEALKAAHHHKTSTRLQSAVKRVGIDALQLLEVFPDIRGEVGIKGT